MDPVAVMLTVMDVHSPLLTLSPGGDDDRTLEMLVFDDDVNAIKCGVLEMNLGQIEG